MNYTHLSFEERSVIGALKHKRYSISAIVGFFFIYQSPTLIAWNLLFERGGREHRVRRRKEVDEIFGFWSKAS
jgi:hypothetical protein